MGLMEAMIGIVTILIILAVFIPITQELLPDIIQYCGSATGMMVSSIVIVIIVGALYVFINQMMNRESHAEIQGGV
jgi:hypothetical protein